MPIAHGFFLICDSFFKAFFGSKCRWLHHHDSHHTHTRITVSVFKFSVFLFRLMSRKYLQNLLQKIKKNALFTSLPLILKTNRTSKRKTARRLRPLHSSSRRKMSARPQTENEITGFRTPRCIRTLCAHATGKRKLYGGYCIVTFFF